MPGRPTMAADSALRAGAGRHSQYRLVVIARCVAQLALVGACSRGPHPMIVITVAATICALLMNDRHRRISRPSRFGSPRPMGRPTAHSVRESLRDSWSVVAGRRGLRLGVRPGRGGPL